MRGTTIITAILRAKTKQSDKSQEKEERHEQQ